MLEITWKHHDCSGGRRLLRVEQPLGKTQSPDAPDGGKAHTRTINSAASGHFGPGGREQVFWALSVEMRRRHEKWGGIYVKRPRQEDAGPVSLDYTSRPCG